MANILKQDNIKARMLRYKNDLAPVLVEYRNGASAKLTLSSGEIIDSVCIQCKDLNCINFIGGRVVLEELKNSQTNNICPTNAIYLSEQGVIDVRADACIGCGLCVASCPVGSIFINENNIAAINHDTDNVVDTSDAVTLKEVQSTGPAIEENEESFRSIFESIGQLQSRTVVMNRLVCKSLQLAGVDTYLTRQGDVNLRMDGIGLLEDEILLIEAEITADLDSPRDILDDYAVFCSRYDVDRTHVSGLILLTEFPNTRTEFWELITDIEKIVDVRIATISLAVLLTIVWSKSKLQLADFYLGKGNTSARQGVSTIIRRDINLSKANNLVEAAK